MNKRLLFTLLATMALAGTAHAGGDAAKGKQKAEVCAGCHGADGVSPAGQFPTLAGQHADYLERALLDYKSGDRKNAVMKGFVDNLSREDIRDLSAWFASQKGLYIRY